MLSRSIWGGFQSVFSSIAFIHEKKLWFYIIIPLSLTIFLGLLLKFSLLITLLRFINNFFHQTISLDIPFLSSLITIIINIIVFWALSFVMVFFLNIIGKIVWSFFSPLLQQRIYTVLKIETQPTSQNNLKWFFLSFLDILKDFIFLIFCYGISSLFLFIPFIGIFLQVISMFLMNSYIIGRSHFRTALIPLTQNLKQRDQIISQYFRKTSFGIGLVIMMAYYLPFIDISALFFFWAGAITSAIRYYYELSVNQDSLLE